MLSYVFYFLFFLYIIFMLVVFHEKIVVISLISFLIFCEFNCNEFSIRLVKIA